MANNTVGFNYINYDTDRYQDIKIKRLKKDFKGNGVSVYDYIVNEIYRVKGCFLIWDDSAVFDVAEYWGLSENEVKNIVNFCCLIGLFNEQMLSTFGVLTARSIQIRFLKWSKLAKRKDAKVPEKFNLIQEEQLIIPENCGNIQEVCDEEKKRKETQSKEKGKEGNFDVFTPPDFSLVFDFFKDKIGVTNWTEDKCRLEAKNFIDYYAKTGWVVKNGPIINWQNAASGWIANDQKFTIGKEKNKTSDKSELYPKYYSKNFEAMLPDKDVKGYWAHLRGLGFVPKKDNQQRIIDWVKSDAV